jgi:hypothetical protein
MRRRGVEPRASVTRGACIVNGDRIHIQQVLLNQLFKRRDCHVDRARESAPLQIIISTATMDGFAIGERARTGETWASRRNVEADLRDSSSRPRKRMGNGLAIAHPSGSSWRPDLSENNTRAGRFCGFTIPSDWCVEKACLA